MNAAHPTRRRCLRDGLAGVLAGGTVCAIGPLLGGCAAAIDAAAADAANAAGATSDPSTAAAEPGSTQPGRDEPLLTRWRTLTGGLLAPPSPGVGLPARPGSGMFVRWVGPTAVALRGQDLLLLDGAAGRLWRADAALNTVTGIAGAPTSPGVALALGPDLSAWVLDPAARQVLRFARDGRLLQTWRIDTELPSPVTLALADGGATLLVGDGMGAQWAEQRSPSAPVLTILPLRVDGQRISGVDGLATQAATGRGGAADAVWVLDRLAGVVHRVRRDGRVTDTLGRGDLLQPSALVVDRFERVFVVDRQGRALVCLRVGAPAQRFEAAALGVQQIGGLAIDDRLLALTDALAGPLVLQRLGRPAAP